MMAFIKERSSYDQVIRVQKELEGGGFQQCSRVDAEKAKQA